MFLYGCFSRAKERWPYCYQKHLLLGDNILDPMCGGGSIPIEGALAFPGTNFFGGDVHPLALERCQQNVAYNHEKLALCSINFSATTWDATKLPFEDNFFNAIVTDMP